ncbi:MAG TPA: hypothetical protein VI215_01520 [Bacteroidota bacterium]|jgi:hypothetical protein
MGTNLLFSILSFVLFGTLLVSDNNLVTSAIQLSSETEVSQAAFALAQSVIDEAKTKAFDQNTVAGEVADSSFMSATLGPNGGESIGFPDTLAASGYKSSSIYNDVDDYNGYWRLVRTSSRKGDTVRVAVNYANVGNPDASLPGRNYAKKMTVTVSSPFVSRSYSFSYVFSY